MSAERDSVMPGCDLPRTPPADDREVRDVPKEPRNPASLSERLAAYAHAVWLTDMGYMFSKSLEGPDNTVTIPAARVRNFSRLASTPFDQLSDEDRVAARVRAAEILTIVRSTDQSFPLNKALLALSEAVGHPCLEPRWNEDLGDALVRYVIERYIKADAVEETKTVPLPKDRRPSELDVLKEAYWAAIRRLRELGERSVPLV